MGMQATTAKDAALSAKRRAFVEQHKLRDFKLSWKNLSTMVRTSTGDRAVLDELRDRFSHGGRGHWLQWSGPAWDHLEMFGRDGSPLCLISHPYSTPDESGPDLDLFRRADLNVFVCGKDESWYGHGTYHIRVEQRGPGMFHTAEFYDSLNDEQMGIRRASTLVPTHQRGR